MSGGIDRRDGHDVPAVQRARPIGWRDVVVCASDLVAWPVAFAAASQFHGKGIFTGFVLVLSIAACVLHLVVGAMSGLCRRVFRPYSFEEAGAVAITAGGVGIVLVVLEQIASNRGYRGQIIVLATAAAVTIMFGHRYLRRFRAQLIARAAQHDREPVIVLGAGDGGLRAIRAMESVTTSPYRPVALIDDDPRKRSLRLGGVRVQGTTRDLERVARQHGATSVLLALPSATKDDLVRLHELVKAAGLTTLVMPPAQQWVGTGSTREITRYRDEDILRRSIVDIDMDAVRDLVQGARVLVTGGGGSIGSELVRQLSALEPARLVVLDHDDSLIHAAMASVDDAARDRCVPVLADIRDDIRLDEIFEEHRPQLVFHAAALKHVPALEGAAGEGWKTNVLGSALVIGACERHGVARFVNISTDKAADPVNVLGATKRIAERLTAHAARRNRRPYVSVRFGNVIGSRGSAIETFERQIASGGPVTITHPDMTRYFMAVREAVLLTMQAAAIGRPGEVLVLDMGAPVKVVDVARQLIEQSGQPVPISYIGLRPGEKMHEVLLGGGEAAHRPFHPSIDHVTVPGLDLDHGLDACHAAGVSPTTLPGLLVMATHNDERSRVPTTTRQVERARSGHVMKGVSR